MKKRLLAAFMSAVMVCGMLVQTAVPTFARSTVSESEYNYRHTDGLEIDNVGSKIILTWPTIDSQGGLLNDNPLRSYAMTGSTTPVESKDPMLGWSVPYRGMIVAYDGWQPGYSSGSSTDLTGAEDVIRGIVGTKPNDSAVEVMDYSNYDTGSNYFTGDSGYIDTTVVSHGFAYKYEIQYSDNGGQSFKTAGTIAMPKHQKKLRFPDPDGTSTRKDMNDVTYIEDGKNTIFLIDQQVEEFPEADKLLEEGKTYTVKVVPLDSTGKPIELDPSIADGFTKEFTAGASDVIKVDAFPGVEGGGKNATGGRSTLSRQGEVYVVTSLEDSVSQDIPGTLRYGLKHRTNVNGELVPLTIVFAVGGTIHIDPNAAKNQRRFDIGSNITIAGQTAPGEGITIAGGTCNVSGENIILRYLRFRTGEGYEIDGATASGKNIIIDHCSFGWGVDETFSAKELVDSTISYNIISSGLAMVNKNGANNTDAELLAGENEFKHGMGSLLNGYETTITHNLWAHNGTRNPRFEGGFEYGGKKYDNLMTYANNVVYNWGHNPSYGGERGNGQVNFEGNYYKAGPNTLDKCYGRIMDFDSSSTNKSSYYISGNYINGAEADINNTNAWYDKGLANIVNTRYTLTNDYAPTSAEAAYNAVLDGVGASYVRDAQDARLIEEVKTGDMGGFINSEKEAGGYESDVYTDDSDKDKDGIADSYESLLNMPAEASSTTLITDENSPFYGYTYLEVYINDILGAWGENGLGAASGSKAERTVSSSQLAVKSITGTEGDVYGALNTDLIAGNEYTIGTTGTVSGGSFSVLIDGEKVSDSLTFTAPEDIGAYSMIVKYRPNGSGSYAPYTISEPVQITVLGSKNTNIEGFEAADIGTGAAQGGSVSYGDGSLVVQGGGLIGRPDSTGTQGDDSFFFDYKEVEGDFDISAKVDTWAKIDYTQKAGLMVRASITDAKPEFYMNAVTYLKGEDFEGSTGADGSPIRAKNIGPFVRTAAGGKVSEIVKGSQDISKFMSVLQTLQGAEPNYPWLRLAREGQTVTMYGCSYNADKSAAADWVKLAEYTTTLPAKCYVGFAVDAAQDTTKLKKYNKARFFDIDLDGSSAVTDADGDIDGDGYITSNDAAIAYLIGSGKTDEGWNIEKGDVDGSGSVTGDDAQQIMKKVLRASYKYVRA